MTEQNPEQTVQPVADHVVIDQAPAPITEAPAPVDQAPATVEQDAEPFDVEGAIADIPNRFWLTARRRLDLTSDEIVNDGVALSIVLAVRKSISETGLPDWERWLDASQPETNDYLGVDLVDDSKSA